MSLQFNRQCRVTFFDPKDQTQALVVDGLRVRFQLTKTLLGYPTRGKVEIYNLSEANIQRVTKRLTSVRVEAGYGATGDMRQIFLSNIMNYYKTRQNVDSIFTLILSGSAPAWNGSTFNRTYREGVMPAQIIRDVAGSFADVIIGTILEDENWTSKLSSVTHAGSVVDIMNKLSEDYNFDWSVHDGQLDIVPREKIIEDRPVFVITPQTGLLGSPTLTELGADFRILINPDIMLARKLQMSTESVILGQEGLEFRKVRNTADGFYKVMDLRYLGDTRGNEWYCDIIGWRTNEPKQ